MKTFVYKKVETVEEVLGILCKCSNVNDLLKANVLIPISYILSTLSIIWLFIVHI